MLLNYFQSSSTPPGEIVAQVLSIVRFFSGIDTPDVLKSIVDRKSYTEDKSQVSGLYIFSQLIEKVACQTKKLRINEPSYDLKSGVTIIKQYKGAFCINSFINGLIDQKIYSPPVPSQYYFASDFSALEVKTNLKTLTRNPGLLILFDVKEAEIPDPQLVKA